MLCHTFRTIAHQTWDKLAIAKSVGHQISEQAFTDFNLLEMKIRHPKEVTGRATLARMRSQPDALRRPHALVHLF